MVEWPPGMLYTLNSHLQLTLLYLYSRFWGNYIYGVQIMLPQRSTARKKLSGEVISTGSGDSGLCRMDPVQDRDTKAAGDFQLSSSIYSPKFGENCI